jgi:hypothetical protein
MQQLDDSRLGSYLPVTAADVRAAVDAVLAGQSVDHGVATSGIEGLIFDSVKDW